MNKEIFSSPKTTWAAIIAFFAILLTQVGYAVDADPLTNIDWSVIGAQIPILIGLMFARDNNKSSEQVGAVAQKEKVPGQSPVTNR